MRANFRCGLSFTCLLFAACGMAEDGTDPGFIQTGSPVQTGDAAFVDTGVGPGGLIGPDAGIVIPLDAGAKLPDSSIAPGVDAGNVFPWPDASAAGSDAGHVADAGGAQAEAGTDGGASSCALTYDNFGKQFLTTYCTSCHAGFFADHGVQLDTLAGVQKNKAAVKSQTVTGASMPPQNPKPASADRQKLGQWLDCGPN